MNENQNKDDSHVTSEYRPPSRREKIKPTGELVEDKDFEFMKEKIKERPINRKKLVRRTIITASMAVIFGLIACFTFLVLEPVFSNMLYPEEDPKQVTFPEVEEEMLPQDMLQTETQIPGNGEPEEQEEPTTEAAAPSLEVSDYQALYNKMYAVAQESQKSMVTVTGVTSDVDWFNNPYESKGQTSGIILADNGKELLILANKQAVEEAESIQVMFCDGEQATGALRASDATTDLSVISVPLEEIGDDTKDAIAMANLGSSNGNNLLGSAIIAVGTPMGTGNSVAYGMITSVGSTISVPDNAYKLITTDIYGSKNAGGVILDMNGKILGVVDMTYNTEDMENIVCAIGISELKRTITKLSNGKEMAYFGVEAIDVTAEANTKLKVPFGAYVTEIQMDSPAMSSGVQSGDIITKIGNEEIANVDQYVDALLDYSPEDSVDITVMRQGKDEYREMSITVTLGKQSK
ncbi:MAG: S1C family serine protease [Lachnospiraceae bacterium]|nr:S1C family serine protease [Lachnospiraceae bacterium]